MQINKEEVRMVRDDDRRQNDSGMSNYDDQDDTMNREDMSAEERELLGLYDNQDDEPM
jgi:hypothetical protein